MYKLNERIYPVEKEYGNSGLRVTIKSVFLNYMETDYKKDRIFVVLDGNFNLVFGESNYEMGTHDIFIVTSNKFFFFSTLSTDNLLLEIEFDRKYLEDMNIELYDQILKYSDRSDKILSTLYRLLYLTKNLEGEASDIETKLLYNFDKLLMEVYNENVQYRKDKYKVSTDSQGYIWSIFDDIMNNPFDDHRLAKKEEEYDVSISQISRNFKEVIGTKYNNFITYIRLDRSLDMLLYTDKNVLDIALEIGFNSSKAYHENFRKYVADTPHKFKTMVSNIKEEDFKYRSLDSVFDSDRIMLEMLRFESDTTSNIEHQSLIKFDYSDIKKFKTINKKQISENYVLDVDTVEKLNDIYMLDISGDLNIERIRILVKIGKTGGLYFVKGDNWILIDGNSLGEFLGLVSKYKKKIIVSVKFDNDALMNSPQILATISQYLNTLTNLLGIQRLETCTFEYFIDPNEDFEAEDYDIYRNFLARAIKKRQNYVGRFNIAVNLGNINDLESQPLLKELALELIDNPEISHITFLVNNEIPLNGALIDIQKEEEIIRNSVILIKELFSNNISNKKVFVNISDFHIDGKYLPKKYYGTANGLNLLREIRWILQSGIGIIKRENDGMLNNGLVLKDSNFNTIYYHDAMPLISSYLIRSIILEILFIIASYIYINFTIVSLW